MESRLASVGKDREALKQTARTVRASLARVRQSKTDTARAVQASFADLTPMFADAAAQIARRVTVRARVWMRVASDVSCGSMCTFN